MAQDILSVVVRYRYVQCVERMRRWERRRVLDGGNDVRDAELGQLLRVFGSGQTG